MTAKITPERVCRVCGVKWHNKGRYDIRRFYCSPACREAYRRKGRKAQGAAPVRFV